MKRARGRKTQQPKGKKTRNTAANNKLSGYGNKKVVRVRGYSVRGHTRKMPKK